MNTMASIVAKFLQVSILRSPPRHRSPNSGGDALVPGLEPKEHIEGTQGSTLHRKNSFGMHNLIGTVVVLPFLRQP